MRQLSYTPLGVITHTWEHARFLNKSFDAEFGIVALEKFCELEPGVISTEEEDLYRPTTYADFVENIIQILGPDIEFIMSVLAGVARSFEAHGGKAEYMISIGDSIVYSVEKCLNRHLKEEEINAFDEVFNAICREICKNLKGAPPAPMWHHHTSDNHRNKKSTLDHTATNAPKDCHHEIKGEVKHKSSSKEEGQKHLEDEAAHKHRSCPEDEAHKHKSSSTGTSHFHFPHLFGHRHSSNCRGDGTVED